VNFLSQLVVIHETEGLVFADAEISVSSGFKLTAKCLGERFDPARHHYGLHIKAVSYHLIDVCAAQESKPAVAQVLFDI